MYGRNTKRNVAGGAGKGKKNTSPIRVVVKCAWSGTRLTVPCDPPIRASSTSLLDLVQRLQPELPPSLFLSGGNDGGATLVCLRKLVTYSQWGTTTLGSILDGDDGAAGVVLTLDLGGGGLGLGRSSDTSAVNSFSAAPTTMTMARTGLITPIDNAISSAASTLNIKPAALIVESSSVNTTPSTDATITIPEPMDIVDDKPNRMSPEEAWDEVLRSNFDATTKGCLIVLLKLIDNLLSRPDEPKFRSIRCANATFEKKVGMVKGGYEFLYSVGFVPRYPAFASSTVSPEMLELLSENESREMLLRGRCILTQSAVSDLGMSEEELPAPPNTKSPPIQVHKPISSTTTISGEFDIYKGHSYNIQSAAVGAPDPYGDKGMSTTERQLQNLQSKKEKLEREMQTFGDRGLVAYNAGETPQIATSAGGDGGEGKSDGSLLAARMKRMDDERKKREEGGFTTKAMRDLESMKKAKVYSHAQIRINFPDGKHLHARFLPSETISSIRSVIKSACKPSLAVSLVFDLYVAPPRRLLNDTKTLIEEELVPAAKIHVSWKVGSSPIGDYLLDELFSGGSVSAFPDAKPVVRQQSTTATSIGVGVDTNSTGGAAAPSKEELLMQRMLGKTTGLLGGKKKSGDSDQDSGKKNDKPKWLK